MATIIIVAVVGVVGVVAVVAVIGVFRDDVGIALGVAIGVRDGCVLLALE